MVAIPMRGNQSWESFVPPSICSNCSLMPPDTALIFPTLFLLLYTGYCRDSARSPKILVILLQLCTNVCSLWVGETTHAFTGYLLYHIHPFVRDLCPHVLSSSLVCVLKHPHVLKYMLHLLGCSFDGAQDSTFELPASCWWVQPLYN